jgi:hypothetical protein
MIFVRKKHQIHDEVIGENLIGIKQVLHRKMKGVECFDLNLKY